jgi:outer membrane protein insertion porin family
MKNVPNSRQRRGMPRAAAFAAAFALLAGVLPAAAQQDPAGGGRVVIDSIEVVGNERVPMESILGTLTFRAGDTVSFTDLQQTIARVWATRQFADIKQYAVTDSADPGGPILWRLVVEEQPIVTQIEFTGLENIRASAVRDSAGLQSGLPLDPAAIAEAEAQVRMQLASKGFRVRSIGHRLEDIPDRPGDKRLIFEVSEGQRVAVADVEFEGNEAFTDEDLTSVMAINEEGFLWYKSGTFDDEQLRTDLRDLLPAFYSENGFIDFTVLGDSLVVDPETGKARVIITVDEGPQYVLEDFAIEGNRRFATEDLRRYFEARRGGLLRSFGLNIGAKDAPVEGQSVFDAIAFEQAKAEVEQLYRNSGYLYASVAGNVERIPAEDGGAPTVRAAWYVQEGQPAFVNEIRIVGNTFTHEDVIRGQLLVLPGSLYSEEALIQSYQRVSALGFFETPMPLPRMEETGTGDVNLVFEVKEKQTGSVNFGTALGGPTGLAGFLGYDQPNLFGQAKSGHLRWEFGTYSNNFEASYSDPAILGSLYSGSLSLFSSSDRFFQFAEGRRHRTGAGVRVGIPFLGDQWTRLSLGYSLSRTAYREFDEEQQSSVFSLPPGYQSTVTLALSRTTVDHPLFPTVGTRQELSADLSGGVLGGDGDFQKYSVSGSWYVPVGQLGGRAPGTRPIRFTLGLTAEAGAIFGDASRFPFDRFWMGGVQFGTPLRGYDETTITPLGYVGRCTSGSGGCPPLEERFGDAYLRLSAEYALRLNDNISLSTFYDAGNVWREPGEFNPTRLLRGAGVGLTLVTPFGPLGLDYAYGFDKTNPGWQLHFKFGQGF